VKLSSKVKQPYGREVSFTAACGKRKFTSAQADDSQNQRKNQGLL